MIALELSHKSLYKAYTEKMPIEASELSFTNLFLWRDKYNFHIEWDENALWVINVKDQTHHYYSMPLGPVAQDEVSLAILKKYKEVGPFTIKKATERFIKLLDDQKLAYVITPVRDDFDYIYLVKDLQDLTGNRYHKKKNHVNKFLKTFENWHYEALSHANLHQGKSFIEDYFKKEQDPALLWEQRAIEEGLLYFEDLPLKGGLLLVEEKPVAFTLGEGLNEETLVIHFEKADTAYHGTYNMINKLFLEEVGDEYKWVNREQDLGIPGLRKAKESYHPHHYLKKYNLEILGPKKDFPKE